jgi:hypothetical protein
MFAPVRICPGAQTTSYTMGTGSLTGVRRPGRGVNHPTPPSAEVKETAELHLYSPFRGMILYPFLTACVLHALRIRTGVGRQDGLCSKQLPKDELEHK